MIRSIIPADTDALVAMTEATGLFRPAEIVALGDLLNEFHTAHCAPHHHAIAWTQDNDVLGFAYYGLNPLADRTWQLYWIVVRQDQQGAGLGTRLLRHVEDDIRTNHHARLMFIETGSIPQYERTRQFYLKHGYEQHALLKDFYAQGDSMVVFRKAF